MRTSLKVGTIAALAFAVACGDSSGPGTLDQAQKTALNNALTASGALSGVAAAFSPYTVYVVNSIDAVGHMSGAAAARLASDIEASINASVAAAEYDAVGLVIDFTIPIGGGSNIEGAAAFVFGWNGLSTSANPVSEFVSAGLVKIGSNSSPTGTLALPGISEDQFALASYYEQSTGSQYVGTTGSVTISSADFSGSSQTCPGTDVVPTVTCSFSTGTMGGQFAFEAMKAIGSGADSYSQSQINFANLPAIRVSLTVTEQ